jgi:lipoprotein-anchoring transpeptidase ErfK/SrfK
MAVAAAALLIAQGASAQTYEQDGARAGQDEYGTLLRQATEGREPVREAPRPTQPTPAPTPRPQAAPKPTPSQAARTSGEFLHSSSEYANEAHTVRLVDRSRFDSAFLPADVPNTIRLAPGQIFIDVKARQLYFAKSENVLRRYGVAVGREGAAWKGVAVVGRGAKWPDWRPTANIRRENRKLKAVVKGGSSNPLGARAMYLYKDGRDTLYRIHGTNAPYSIGKFASHGCIRMINEDVIELYEMVRKGAVVHVK